MAKYSLTKESVAKLRALNTDEGFHARALNRIDLETNAVYMLELEKVGKLGHEITDIDLVSGSITVEDIIKPKEASTKIVTAKK